MKTGYLSFLNQQVYIVLSNPQLAQNVDAMRAKLDWTTPFTVLSVDDYGVHASPISNPRLQVFLPYTAGFILISDWEGARAGRVA